MQYTLYIHGHFLLLLDNSGIPPAISSIPVIQSPMKFKIGSTKIRIQATDLAGNIQKCQFSITVLGKYKYSVENSGFFCHSDFTWNQFWWFQKFKICYFCLSRSSQFWFWWILAFFWGPAETVQWQFWGLKMTKIDFK